MFICIAGKNNIAVDVLAYLISLNGDFELGVVCNKTETGNNNWQKSLRWFAKKYNVKEYLLEEMYNIPDLVFLSLEFDQIIKTERFKDARIYNIHFSMLPKYKGMYTSAWPILNGEDYSGVTFHKIDNGIDTGDIIAQKQFSIRGMTCRELYNSYIVYGTELVINCLNDVLNNCVKALPQKIEHSTYYSRNSLDYSKITIDYNQTADCIARQIRAFSFREYQLPKFKNKSVISTEITKIKSVLKPGSIIIETDSSVMISSIDYNIILYYDRFNDLMKACENGDLLQVKEICAVKEHINSKNENGWTPLIVATYNNHCDIVKYLINAGADIYAKNNNGTNLLMYAKEAYKKSNDTTLYSLFQLLGLSEHEKDYYGNDLIYYLEKERIIIK